jgi:hypothetical protein
VLPNILGQFLLPEIYSVYSNTVAIPNQFENTDVDNMSLYVFMKLTTRSTNVAFIGYYEFYSRLQCNLDCIVIYIYS